MSINPAERVLVIIDGGNTYQALFKPNKNEKGVELAPAMIPPGCGFNFKSFADYLVNGRTCVGIKFHIGTVRNLDGTPKSQELVEKQQKFLQKLQDSGLTIERGRIVYDHKPREKGVDVKIAIDIVLGAVQNEYDTVILLSSDTDLMPAVNYVHTQGKKLEYIGFSHRFSNALLNNSTEKRIFAAADLEAFHLSKPRKLPFKQ